MNQLVLSLDDPQATEEALAGAKAAAAARLRQTENEGQPGFVVPAHVYRTAPHGEITPDVEAAVAAAYARLGADAPVAVSASPTDESVPVVSFEGVVGLAKILSAIEACWQSLTAPQALAYFQHAARDGSSVVMGVLVQAVG